MRYGLIVHLLLLSTPPRGDAVTFGYKVPEHSDRDFHPADSMQLQARQDRPQAGDLELRPGAFNIPGQPGKLAQHGTGKIPDMCEIQQDPVVSLPAIAFDTRLAVAHDPGIVRLEESLGKPAEA